MIAMRCATCDAHIEGSERAYPHCPVCAMPFCSERRLELHTETVAGTSLVAAGFHIVGEVKGRSWNTPSRPRVDLYPLQDKFRWEVAV